MVSRGICEICERFFEKRTKEQFLCDECHEKSKKEFEIVKEYLFENKGASIMDVFIHTKIPVKTIKRFIKEEKIEVIED